MKKICKNGHEFEDDGKKSSLCPDCRSALGRRNKRKGNSNELRFSKYLNEQFQKYGFKYVAKRTPRSGGIQEFEPADIMFRFVPSQSIFSKIHFENKNTGQWDIQGWHNYAEQKEKETGRGRNPILIIRKPNSHDEFAVMKMEYLVELLLNIEKFKEENNNGGGGGQIK